MNNFAQLSDREAKFLVRWRGRTEGPYSASVIDAKLAANEIGLLHEVFHDGKWLAIRDYLAEREVVLRAENEAREEREQRAREESEREERARQESIEAQKLVELKRQNDLLDQQNQRNDWNSQPGRPDTRPPLITHAPKSRFIYIILGLFLGGLGIHNFYAGFNSKGFAQLVITIVGLFLLFPLLIVFIWVLIDLITVSHDANGVKFQ
jgi:TM2 domain-containing membrane protein YozV